MLCSIKWFEFLKNAESSQHKLETAGLIAPLLRPAILHTITQYSQLYRSAADDPSVSQSVFTIKAPTDVDPTVSRPETGTPAQLS